MKYPTFEEVKKAREALRDISIQHWLHDDLFTWRWWLLLIAATIPWLIWLKLRDKKRSFELLSYGLIWAVLASIADVIGADLMLWGYPDKLLPMVPPLLPADITVIPVSFMFIYQYSKDFKTYLIYSLLLSAFFGYILEHLFEKWEMFTLDKWTHTYSFIGFFVFALIDYFMIKKLK
ncbi:CBO0543 family protein [Neobacillus cucumis]|uniref:Uncharacterized protein n=1 Tax=Neobacillus cucumis TaxID=1740721 RepID=A0A2N5HFJ3_9BACI|nr:CBO0543 family protein [Neobacillus cucumis]PLS04296.1 hypothetical protein CVD27_12425 [Neobacillus cucumis]